MLKLLLIGAAIVIGLSFLMYIFKNIMPLIGFIISIAIFVIAAAIGVKLPDADLLLKGIITHRSILTHSFFIPLILGYIGVRHVAVGLSFGFGVHLIADLFRKRLFCPTLT